MVSCASSSPPGKHYKELPQWEMPLTPSSSGASLKHTHVKRLFLQWSFHSLWIASPPKHLKRKMKCEVPAYGPCILNNIQLKVFFQLCFTRNLTDEEKTAPFLSVSYRVTFPTLPCALSLLTCRPRAFCFGPVLAWSAALWLEDICEDPASKTVTFTRAGS